MKRFVTTLALLVMLITSAAAMSLSRARKEALFLTDKMAYELYLSTSQMDAVYEINLDYMLALGAPADLEGIYWMRRNSDLRYVLSPWQWELYTQILDFYRPMYWVSGSRFSLYLRSRYTARHDFFYDRPSIYGSYRGGHNAAHGSFYAGRSYGAPVAPPPVPNNHGTHRSGTNPPPANPGYSIGQTNRTGNQPAMSNQPAQSGRSTVTNAGRTTNVPSSGSVRGRSAANSNVGTTAPSQPATRSSNSTGTTRSSSTTTRGSSTTTRSSSSGSSRSNNSSTGSRRGGR